MGILQVSFRLSKFVHYLTEQLTLAVAYLLMHGSWVLLLIFRVEKLF